MGRRNQKLLLTLLLAALPVAGLIASPQFAVNDGRPADISFPDLSPYQRLFACREQFAKTTASVSAAQRELDQAQSELSTAKREREELPVRISELESQLRRLTSEMDQHRESLATAEKAYSEIADAAPHRIASFRTDAEERSATELQQAVDSIDAARRQRDELRRQRGQSHRIGNQDELLLVRQQKRRATETSTTSLSVEIANFEAIVRGEVAATHERVRTYERLIENAQFSYSKSESELAASRKHLASLPDLIAAAQSRVSSAESRFDRLTASRAVHEDAVALAASSYEQHQRVLSAERERQRQSQLTFAPTSNPSPRFSSRSEIPTGVRSQLEFGASRRFDPSYRPPVGEHYVRSYVKRDGTFVRGHMRTNPDDSFYNNYSSLGNFNPHTSEIGRRRP